LASERPEASRSSSLRCRARAGAPPPLPSLPVPLARQTIGQDAASAAPVTRSRDRPRRCRAVRRQVGRLQHQHEPRSAPASALVSSSPFHHTSRAAAGSGPPELAGGPNGPLRLPAVELPLAALISAKCEGGTSSQDHAAAASPACGRDERKGCGAASLGTARRCDRRCSAVLSAGRLTDASLILRAGRALSSPVLLTVVPSLRACWLARAGRESSGAGKGKGLAQTSRRSAPDFPRSLLSGPFHEPRPDAPLLPPATSDPNATVLDFVTRKFASPNNDYFPSPSNWRCVVLPPRCTGRRAADSASAARSLPRQHPVYTVLLDKHFDAVPENNDYFKTLFEWSNTETQVRHGGDITGLVNDRSLDYMQLMGIKAIFISGTPFLSVLVARPSGSLSSLSLSLSHPVLIVTTYRPSLQQHALAGRRLFGARLHAPLVISARARPRPVRLPRRLTPCSLSLPKSTRTGAPSRNGPTLSTRCTSAACTSFSI